MQTFTDFKQSFILTFLQAISIVMKNVEGSENVNLSFLVISIHSLPFPSLNSRKSLNSWIAFIRRRTSGSSADFGSNGFPRSLCLHGSSDLKCLKLCQFNHFLIDMFLGNKWNLLIVQFCNQTIKIGNFYRKFVQETKPLS